MGRVFAVYLTKSENKFSEGSASIKEAVLTERDRVVLGYCCISTGWAVRINVPICAVIRVERVRRFRSVLCELDRTLPKVRATQHACHLIDRPHWLRRYASILAGLVRNEAVRQCIETKIQAGVALARTIVALAVCRNIGQAEAVT